MFFQRKYNRNEYIKPYERSHYTDNIEKIEKDYINVLNSCKLLS